jgi:hypothetical protein
MRGLYHEWNQSGSQLSDRAAAAILAGGISAFFTGFITTLSEVVVSTQNFLKWVGPVGPLSGKVGLTDSAAQLIAAAAARATIALLRMIVCLIGFGRGERSLASRQLMIDKARPSAK